MFEHELRTAQTILWAVPSDSVPAWPLASGESNDPSIGAALRLTVMRGGMGMSSAEARAVNPRTPISDSAAPRELLAGVHCVEHLPHPSHVQNVDRTSAPRCELDPFHQSRSADLPESLRQRHRDGARV